MQKWLGLWKMDLVQKVSHGVLPDPSEESVIFRNHVYVVLGEIYPEQEQEGSPQQSEQDGGFREEVASGGFLSSLFGRETSSYTDEFLLDVRSRVNFTYRTRFIPIPRAPDGPSPLSLNVLVRTNPINTIENYIANPDCFNTDIGWGCMIRTGQSLLGNALQILHLGRDFRVDNEKSLKRESKIVTWFNDTPEAPFSIHNFVSTGTELSDKRPGEWFGPAATARSIQSLIYGFPECGITDCVVSVSSGDIYQNEVEKIYVENPDSIILFLLGVKLGINAVNESYRESICGILNSARSVGIAGGRPSSSLYFFGYQGNQFLYFDPHIPQPAVEESFVESCHTSKFGKLQLSEMDPSMLIGVLIKGEEDWQRWKLEVTDSTIINILPQRMDDFDVSCNMDDIESVDSNSMKDDTDNNENFGVLEGDYVDIGAILPHTAGTVDGEEDDCFQDIHCKNQKIVVMGNTHAVNANLTDYEVEGVLVEQETVGIPSPINEKC
ncbi:atg4p [Saccharomyces arboricola H-6]|uniref:Cysteine protease n=1 Tax=Saccharomyces arboricola (strain H-6 / AS 2.3317 / CBS 10644) TaxID=1160507 RepID=J8Q3C6_SACAR|nr:atg4p [Saccharomyces arboricola H-6]